MEELAAADHKAPCYDALCALPAAQSISASTIASLLRVAVKQKQYERGLRLCQLPAPQQLPSQQLCELLQLLLLPRSKEHRAQQRERLMSALVQLQAAQELASDAALGLLSNLIQHDSCNSTWNAGMNEAHRLGVLTAVGSQLTSGEVLQLLQQAAELTSSDAVRHIAALASAQGIDDAAGFAAFLEAAMRRNSAGSGVQQLPVMQQLVPEAVLDLIQSGISKGASSMPGTLMHSLLQHPAVSSFSTAMIEQLLLRAAQQQQLGAVAALLKAPAAADVSVDTVAHLLQHAVQEEQICESGDLVLYFALETMQPSLLDLLATQQLSTDAVVSVLSTAVEALNISGISRLCELPSAKHISAGAAQALLQEAVQKGYRVWKAVCSGLPQLGQLQLTGEQLHSYLQDAVAAADSKGVCELCQYAAEAQAAAGAEGVAACGISAKDMQSLLSAALRKSASTDDNLTVAALVQLFEVCAAKALGPDAGRADGTVHRQV
jgi:hypothetical protein